MTDDLIQGLQAAHEDDALEIGLAWNLLGEAANALSSKDAEIAELRARIASAPTVSILGISPTIGIFEYANPAGGFFEATFGECPACPLLGKRVALVLLDDVKERGIE